MRTTVALDDDLVDEAQRLTGTREKSALLQDGQVLGHPAVVGEIPLGHLSDRHEILGLLADLPQATAATDAEVMTLIQTRQISGRGIGYIDADLLGATLLTSGARLWTRDKRLDATASTPGVPDVYPVVYQRRSFDDCRSRNSSRYRPRLARCQSS